MHIVIFGLTISSSWGNGHATLWRGLCRALAQRGHQVTFFERDVPFYAAHRDLVSQEGLDLQLYSDWSEAQPPARRALAAADLGLVTSYCPDGVQAADEVLASAARVKGFYDLDTPVTLDQLQQNQRPAYIGPRGLGDFDLVLSYTGGAALDGLRELLGARRVVPLYGSVDPQVHRPVPPSEGYRATLSYLGTYADDRQPALERLLIEPARRLPRERFVIGGAQYPETFPWVENIYFVRHLPPGEHPAFFSSSRLTLSVTRRAMAAMGHCPSGRLFEAAACGTPVLSDRWEGLEEFFEPGSEILLADTSDEALAALALSDGQLRAIADRARERTLACHTATRRAEEFERAIEGAAASLSVAWPMQDGQRLVSATQQRTT